MKINKIPAIAALVIALAGSFAFKAQPPLANLYGISAIVTGGWQVSEPLDATEFENIHFQCGDVRTAPCTVSSDNVYTAGQVIPTAQGQVETPAKTFIDLAPGQ